jgi:hypothetical protein
MLQKGELLKRNNNVTGFVVTYEDGTKIIEKENYFSKKLNKKCATNWAEIDKSKIASLQIYWRGELMETIQKSPSDTHTNQLEANDWFFSHKGYMDMASRSVKIISRNIGFIENNILHITSIMEDTGEIIRSTRAIPLKG